MIIKSSEFLNPWKHVALYTRRNTIQLLVNFVHCLLGKLVLDYKSHVGIICTS
jgi:hypothetical protein